VKGSQARRLSPTPSTDIRERGRNAHLVTDNQHAESPIHFLKFVHHIDIDIRGGKGNVPGAKRTSPPEPLSVYGGS